MILTELGHSPEGFADSIGLTRPAVSYWLSGKTRPSWKNAEKIETTHDYSKAWVMTGLGNKRAGKVNGAAVGKAEDGRPPPGFQESERKRRRSGRRVSPQIPPLKRA